MYDTAASPARWGVLVSVFLLNVSNNLLYLSYPPVSTDTAAHFKRKEASDADWLTTLGFAASAVGALTSTWAVQHLRLR